MVPIQDTTTIDVLYIPSRVCNATSLPHEHFFKRILIDEELQNIVDKHMIDIYDNE